MVAERQGQSVGGAWPSGTGGDSTHAQVQTGGEAVASGEEDQEPWTGVRWTQTDADGRSRGVERTGKTVSHCEPL